MTDTATHPIVVLGAGPAGMAAGLALHAAGIPALILERYPEARPAGNILNLWPPAIKALELIGVDTDDLGAGCHSTFRNAKGRVRADVKIPEHVVKRYQGGFIGMLRPTLYERMLAALPEGMLRTNSEVTDIRDAGDLVELTLGNGSVIRTPVLIGSDGIDSIVRTHLWGDSPKREHNLHIIGGYTYDMPVEAERNECIVAHTRTVQGSYSAIRADGRDGFQWWVLEAWPAERPAPTDLHAHATRLAAPFSAGLPQLVAATPREQLQRWVIRDREPLTAWSKGRITLSGDAAHATSPYAAYGAGMSIIDGYFLAQHLAGVDLADTAAVRAALQAYDARRIPHTTAQVQQAYQLGQMFHHAPAIVRPFRDFVLDRTPMLQKQVGDKNPAEIVAQLDEMGEGVLAPAR